MIGVILTVFPLRVRPDWILLALAVLIIGGLGVRTAFRGLDWRSEYTLSSKDITASPDDYIAYNAITADLINQNKYSQAEPYALHSIKIYPTYPNFLNLGVILSYQGNYKGAVAAYQQALKYSHNIGVYEDLGSLTLLTGDPRSNKQFLVSSLKLAPTDANLWMYLALLEERTNDNANAKIAISNAASLGQVPQNIYDNIMNNVPFTLNVAGQSLKIP